MVMKIVLGSRGFGMRLCLPSETMMAGLRGRFDNCVGEATEIDESEECYAVPS